MQHDVSTLRRFYESPLGQAAGRSIRRRLASFWPDMQGRRVLAVGYGAPFLLPLCDAAERVVAVMPARQGATPWPPDGPRKVLLGEETALPLPDNGFDRVLLVHAVEASEPVRPMLREIWRVTAEGGRAIAVVPNRRGVWARLEHTPFGHGRPYSQAQIERLLQDNMFVPLRSAFALYAPPSRRRFVRRLAAPWERLGARWLRPFGGVVLCEAEKRVYGALPAAEETRSFATAAVPFPRAARAACPQPTDARASA